MANRPAAVCATTCIVGSTGSQAGAGLLSSEESLAAPRAVPDLLGIALACLDVVEAHHRYAPRALTPDLTPQGVATLAVDEHGRLRLREEIYPLPLTTFFYYAKSFDENSVSPPTPSPQTALSWQLGRTKKRTG